MKRALIAIVDAAHARLYTYQQIGDSEPTLQEQRDLVNAGRQAHGMFSDSKSQTRWNGGNSAMDDHRSDHLGEMDSRFAKTVIGEVARMAREDGFGHIILVASPKMLGELRRQNGTLRDFVVDEVAQDLAWLTSPQVHDHLAAMKLIEPRPRAFQRSR